MDLRPYWTVFFTILVLEIGDKSQIATLLYSSTEGRKPLLVFAAAALALVLATGVGAFAGAQLGRWLDPAVLRWISGVGFVAIGIWILVSKR